MEQIIAIIKEWYPVALQLVGAFALLATLTANKVDDKVVNFLLKIINVLGANFGKAKNDD